MLGFRVTRIIPPGNVYFFDMDGTKFESYTMSGLLTSVRRHCGTEGIDVPADLRAVVEDYMCRRLPEDFCYGDLDGAPRARALTLDMIKKNTMDKAAGCDRTLPAESNRRAVVCANCECNDRTLCPTCVGLVAWSARLVGKPIGAREEWLGVCTVDATSLVAIVHLDDKQPEGEFPAGCWRKS